MFQQRTLITVEYDKNKIILDQTFVRNLKHTATFQNTEK